ncbi:CHAP domain-containing protein [Jeotgalicoccus nanhaiensis]|uniref:LysM peptidoglycan-binding domain-containing protein n=1 Tax=Jeotgalicoccus nanhaiensis TaxID=568603 RepID=A0ABR9XZQ5_9STAP|nr:CHAP domain-containing protein [Jeotgalicoccus nanhaiensis]MBF0754245.1 LysM peptidoglycan-binding domain-containing protein [Jeotgalicoccus nanhaiensis]
MKKTIISAASLTALSAVAAANISASEITVESGDTLWSISSGTAQSVNEIKSLNNLTSDLIFPGDVLKVDAEAPSAAPAEEVEVEAEETATTYTIEAGDTLFAIANQFNVTVDNLKAWNNLSSDLIIAGKTISVAESAAPAAMTVEEAPAEETAAPAEEVSAPAVEEVEAAEAAPAESAPAPAAEEVQTEEVSAPAVEEVEQPQAATPAASAPVTSASNGANYYDWGTCAWYVFEQRSQRGLSVGNMWGDAKNWAAGAQAAGYSVSNSPSVGAIMQAPAYTNGAYGLGHVAIVESVNSDGSIVVSEMQFNGGLGSVSTRTLSASQAASHNFIN